MVEVLTVPDDSCVAVTLSSRLVHRCPFVHETDEGEITLSWACNGRTIEIHSLVAWLTGFKDSEVSHEALTDYIGHYVSSLPGIVLQGVETRWLTGGATVTVATCSTSATPAGMQ